MKLVAKSGARVETLTIERLPHENGGGRFRIALGERGDRIHVVDVRSLGPFVKSLLVDGESHETAVFKSGDAAWSVGWRGTTTVVELVDPLTHLATEAHGGKGASGKKTITAYMPGRVVAVAVAVGDAVAAGQPLVVLEAMKMQNEIQAERAGTVTRLHVASGQAVEGGDPLVEIS